MKIVETSIIYDNPLPQLRSRHSFFPSVCQCADGSLAAVYVVGEAFESVDSTSCISRSFDGGVVWTEPKPLFDKSRFSVPITDYCKVTALPDGRLLVLGYAFLRPDPEKPIGNPETGGLLDDFVFFATSSDNGESWSEMIRISDHWGGHAEASAPVTVLQDGTWITPITGFPGWDGQMTGSMQGRALRSEDGGKRWHDDSVCMAFSAPVTCYEQRMCQLASGTLVCIGWNENTATGDRMENHYTFSTDGGSTWSAPRGCGILGQASSVCALGGEKLLALHAVRRDTDRPGIYGCIVDFSEKKWNVLEQQLLWEPNVPVSRDAHMAEIFAFLKFGQPGAVLLADGDVMMTHWYAEQGQYKTVATRIRP